MVVALFLAGSEQRTLPRQMLSGVRETISPTIAAVATLLIVASIALLARFNGCRDGRHAQATRLARLCK